MGGDLIYLGNGQWARRVQVEGFEVNNVTVDDVRLKDEDGNRPKYTPNGEQLVQLTGSNVQYLNVRDTTDGYRWVYGATKARGDQNFVPFSVTGYRRKAIYLKNNSTTKSIINIRIHLFQSVAQQSTDGAFASFDVSSVAAGASAVIEETQYPLLALPVVGIAIGLYVGPTLEPEGNFSVVLMGGA